MLAWILYTQVVVIQPPLGPRSVAAAKPAPGDDELAPSID